MSFDDHIGAIASAVIETCTIKASLDRRGEKNRNAIILSIAYGFKKYSREIAFRELFYK